MARTRRRQHSAAFKAHVALAAIAGTMTPAQLAGYFGIHRNLVTQWRAHLIQRAVRAFDGHARLTPALPPTPRRGTP
jgi:transposase-like protein